MFQKMIEKFTVSKASDDIDEFRSWQEYIHEFTQSQSLVWLLQEDINLTNILDLTVRTNRAIPADVSASLTQPLYVFSTPSHTMLSQIRNTYINLLPGQGFYQPISKWGWLTYHTGYPLYDTKASSPICLIECTEIIPLSLPNTNIQWLDPEWHATLLELSIEYNGGEHTRAIIVLHCAHTDAAKIFEVATPTAAILNGLTEKSDPHPYRKDGAILNAVTKLNPRFVGMDTPEFINDRVHTAGSVEWYTTQNGEWTHLSLS